VDTRLLKMAQAKGLGSISGTEMFVNQAARQFEIWTGKPAPIDGMRQVLLRQLGAVGGENSAPIPTVVPPKAKVLAANAVSNPPVEAPANGSESAAATKAPEAKPEVKAVETKASVKPEKKAAAKEIAKAPMKTAPAKAASAKAQPVKASAKVVAKPKPAPKKETKPVAKKTAKPVAKKR